VTSTSCLPRDIEVDRAAALLFVTFYAAMAGAALIVELLFGAVGLIPAQRNARVVEASIAWDYTTWLNIAFLILAARLVWRFLKMGGPAMLRMMNMPAAVGQSHQTINNSYLELPWLGVRAQFLRYVCARRSMATRVSG
jgi:uncharacterized membrane protein YraQ (UPF0718 family)